MQGVIERLFHSSVDGKDYLLRKRSNGNEVSLSQITKKNGVKEEVPLRTKYYAPDGVFRCNIRTGATSEIRAVSDFKLYSCFYELADKLGIRLNSLPKNKMLKEISVNDRVGTTFSLLVRDGEILASTKDGYCFNPKTLKNLSPLSKKWAIKLAQKLAKAIF